MPLVNVVVDPNDPLVQDLFRTFAKHKPDNVRAFSALGCLMAYIRANVGDSAFDHLMAIPKEMLKREFGDKKRIEV